MDKIEIIFKDRTKAKLVVSVECARFLIKNDTVFMKHWISSGVWKQETFNGVNTLIKNGKVLL
jgi:hypothetical protein